MLKSPDVLRLVSVYLKAWLTEAIDSSTDSMPILFKINPLKSISLTQTAQLLNLCFHSIHQSNSKLSLLGSVLLYHLQSVKSFVFLLSPPLFKSCASPVIFITWYLFSLPPSINKQFLLSCFLTQLYFHLEPSCSLSSVATVYQSHPFLSAHYPL